MVEVEIGSMGIVLLHDLNDPEGTIQTWEGLLQINPLAMAPNGRSVSELVEQLKDESTQRISHAHASN